MESSSGVKEKVMRDSAGAESVILVIPWMVIQELDHIKDDKRQHPDESAAAHKVFIPNAVVFSLGQGHNTREMWRAIMKSGEQ